MITVIAKLTVQEGKEEEFKAAGAEMVAAVKANEAGRTLMYTLTQNQKAPTEFYFIERYADDGRARQITARRRTWRRLAARSAGCSPAVRRSSASTRSPRSTNGATAEEDGAVRRVDVAEAVQDAHAHEQLAALHVLVPARGDARLEQVVGRALDEVDEAAVTLSRTPRPARRATSPSATRRGPRSAHRCRRSRRHRCRRQRSSADCTNGTMIEPTPATCASTSVFFQPSISLASAHSSGVESPGDAVAFLDEELQTADHL